MPLHWPSVIVGTVAVLVFMLWFPAPKGCGCAGRKRRIEDLGEELFGA